MPALVHQRCFNHALREAAARCPACERFYCRECVTEHEDRIICAACLRQAARPPFTQRRGFVAVSRAVQLGGALMLTWLFFYAVGKSLLAIPSSFHEGTVWEQKLLEGR